MKTCRAWHELPPSTPSFYLLLWSLHSSHGASFLFFQEDFHVSSSCSAISSALNITAPCAYVADSVTFSRKLCKYHHLKEIFPHYKIPLCSTSYHSFFHLSFFMLRIDHFLTNVMLFIFIFPSPSHECKSHDHRNFISLLHPSPSLTTVSGM